MKELEINKLREDVICCCLRFLINNKKKDIERALFFLNILKKHYRVIVLNKKNKLSLQQALLEFIENKNGYNETINNLIQNINETMFNL